MLSIPFRAAPPQELPHQRVGHSPAPPRPLGVDVHDQPLRPANQPLAGDVGSGQELPQLEARACDDSSRPIVQLGDPTQVAAIGDGRCVVRAGGLDQGIVQAVRQLAHVAEHFRPMTRENARVGGGGSADPVHR